MRTTEKESKKVIRTFSLASFLNDLGSDMIYPVWPLFITTILGADMAILGLIDGLGEAIVSISQAASGYFSDKMRKRKVFIWTGYLFSSVSRIGYAMSSMWQHLIFFKAFDRLGKIRGAPRDAMVADVSTRKNRGRNFGLLRMMDNLGATFGVILCIILFGYLGYRNLFLLASVPTMISALLIFVVIKEKKTKKNYKGLSLKNLTANLKLFLLSSSLFTIGFFSYSFLLIYAKEFGFQETFIPVLYLVFTLVASLMSIPFGKLADKFTRKMILILSYGFFMLMCLGFIFVESYLGIIMLFVLYGFHLGSRIPVERAFVSELSPLKYRASTLGAFRMITGLFALPASLIAGLLWDNFGKTIPFYLSLFLTIISILLLLFVKEKKSELKL